MRFRKYLRIARQLSRNPPNSKQHIVVRAAFTGSTLCGFRLNTDVVHAEIRAMDAWPEADRLVVYRFNAADSERNERPSCSCFKCCPKIRGSKVTRVEYLSPLGPVCVKVEKLQPYNGKDRK